MSFFESDSGILVPSSVRRQELEEEAPGLLDVITHMREAHELQDYELTTWQVYLAFCALQLTCSHPRLPDRLKADMEALARELQCDLISIYPETTGLLEAGWHRELDDVPGQPT